MSRKKYLWVFFVILITSLILGICVPGANAGGKKKISKEEALEQKLRGESREAARVILSDAPRRYTRIELKTVRLAKGEILEYDQTMDRHTVYFFCAAGDRSVKKIELEIAGIMHETITFDDESKRVALVKWSPPVGEDGTFRLKIQILEGKAEEAFVSLWMAYGSK